MAPDAGTLFYDDVFTGAYDELCRLAGKLKRAYGDPALDSTALVHEAYIRLAGAKELHIESKQHLKYTVVRAMKLVLLDAARRQAAAIRGGGDLRLQTVTLGDRTDIAAGVDISDLLAVGVALEKLARRSELQARVFELQFVAGLRVAEIAHLVGRSEKKVQRTLHLEKKFLALELGPECASSA